LNIITFLFIIFYFSSQLAFAAVNEISDDKKSQSAASTIDFFNFNNEDAYYLGLQIEFFGSDIGFQFKGKVIHLQEIDVLRAQLVDALEEIATLKEMVAATPTFLAVPYISLRATSNAGNGNCLSWPTVVHNSSPEVFQAATTKITVLQAGVYQIHFRLGVINSTNGYATFLQVNGANVAQAYLSDASSHYNTEQLTEILVLEANDELTVSNQCNKSNVITTCSPC